MGTAHGELAICINSLTPTRRLVLVRSSSALAIRMPATCCSIQTPKKIRYSWFSQMSLILPTANFPSPRETSAGRRRICTIFPRKTWRFTNQSRSQHGVSLEDNRHFVACSFGRFLSRLIPTLLSINCKCRWPCCYYHRGR